MKQIQNEQEMMNRHSMAHVLAKALQELYPSVKLTIGPALDNGFYYDIDLDKSLTPEDFKTIENKTKGSQGSPVIGDEKAIKSKNPDAKNKLVGFDRICKAKSEPNATPPPVARVITIPEDIAIKRDGT